MIPAGALYFFLCLLICGFFLNICGIYCCIKQKSRLTKQKVILLNLSAVEITVIVYTLCYLGISQISFTTDKELNMVNKIMCTLYHGVTSLFYNAMLLISVDRFVCIAAQMYYQIHVTESKLRKTVLVIWITSFAYTLVVAFLTELDVQTKVVLYSSYIMQGLFITISGLAYLLVGRSQRRRNKLFQLSTPKMKSRRNRKTFLVSFSLIASFVIFYVIPNHIHSKATAVSVLMISFTHIGLIVDPILYTLLHPALRNIVKNLFLCDGANFNHSDLMERRGTVVMTSSPMHPGHKLVSHMGNFPITSLSTSPSSDLLSSSLGSNTQSDSASTTL